MNLVVTALTTKCGNTQDDQQTGQLVVSTLQGGGKRGHRIDAEAAAGGHLIVQPLAVRGRDGGAQLEIGPEGGPYNALRAANGGSSRTPLIAVSTTGQTAHTLTSEGHDASEDGTGRGMTETVVRRLTPLECERLQGFPDNWTATSNGKPQADSARYRQMGNAVAVPCVEWIARRMTSPTTHPIPESEARRG